MPPPTSSCCRETVMPLAASLSALLLHQRRWLLGHAGDTRVWLFRDNQLKLLTRDHVLPNLRQTPQFSRAVGLVPQIEADFSRATSRKATSLP